MQKSVGLSPVDAAAAAIAATDSAYTDSAETVDTAKINTALEQVRQLLRADGGDIAVSQVSDTGSGLQVELELILKDSSCPECVLPAAMLEPMALEMMSAELPGLSSVAIIDPRET